MLTKPTVTALDANDITVKEPPAPFVAIQMIFIQTNTATVVSMVAIITELTKMVVQQRFHLAEVTGILLLQTLNVASLDNIEHGIKLVFILHQCLCF